MSRKIMPKNLVFVMKVMSGGGAERVISLLTSAAVNCGYDVTLLITHQKKQDSVLRDIDSGVRVISLPDEAEQIKASAFFSKILLLLSRVLGKVGRMFSEKIASKALVLKYFAYNFNDICFMKKYFRKHSDASVIAFLYDSIFYSLLSVTKKNKLVISERGDPCQSLSSRTTMAFLKNEFHKADGVIFQSPDVQKWYLENTSVKGSVIFNPVKPDLPEPYCGERKKRIVNFCRISAQKNLIMLVDAFVEFHKDFPEYELDIIGDSVGNDAEGYVDLIKQHISQCNCESCVHILPSRKDIHEYIKDYTMFVSSSDYEGMSNSMLEAMAMGLPCVCTDCPAGGARAVIKDGENGLLTPVGDSHALYLAMKKVAENPHLAAKLSQIAVKIREEQSVDKIIKKWMELING